MINPNFYTFQDLSFREFEKSVDYFLKARQVKNPIAREMTILLEAKHFIESLIYDAQSCEILAESCEESIKQDLLKSAREFRRIATERRSGYGNLYAGR